MSINEDWKVGGNLTAGKLNRIGEAAVEEVQTTLGYDEIITSDGVPANWVGYWTTPWGEPITENVPEVLAVQEDQFKLYKLCSEVPEEYIIADGEELDHYGKRIYAALMDEQITGRFAMVGPKDSEENVIITKTGKSWLTTLKATVMELMPYTDNDFFGCKTEAEVEEFLMYQYDYGMEHSEITAIPGATGYQLLISQDWDSIPFVLWGAIVLFEDFDNPQLALPKGLYIWGTEMVEGNEEGGQAISITIPVKETVVGIKEKFIPDSIKKDINSLKLEVNKAQVFQKLAYVYDDPSMGLLGSPSLYKDVTNMSESDKLTYDDLRKAVIDDRILYLSHMYIKEGDQFTQISDMGFEMISTFSTLSSSGQKLQPPLQFLTNVINEEGNLNITTISIPFGYGRYYREGPESQMYSGDLDKMHYSIYYITEDGSTYHEGDYLYYDLEDEEQDRWSWSLLGNKSSIGDIMSMKSNDFNLDDYIIPLNIHKENSQSYRYEYIPRASEVYQSYQKGRSITLNGSPVINCIIDTGSYTETTSLNFDNSLQSGNVAGMLTCYDNGNGTYSIYQVVSFANTGEDVPSSPHWQKVTSSDQTFISANITYGFDKAGLTIPDDLVPGGEHSLDDGTVFLDSNKTTLKYMESGEEKILKRTQVYDELVITAKELTADFNIINKSIRLQYLTPEPYASVYSLHSSSIGRNYSSNTTSVQQPVTFNIEIEVGYNPSCRSFNIPDNLFTTTDYDRMNINTSVYLYDNGHWNDAKVLNWNKDNTNEKITFEVEGVTGTTYKIYKNGGSWVCAVDS